MQALVGFSIIVGVVLVTVGVICFTYAICQIYTNRKIINAILDHLDLELSSEESMAALEMKEGKE